MDSAAAPALDFALAVAAGDALAAWGLMDPNFRLCYAQLWAYHNDATEADAAELAEAGPGDERWLNLGVAMLESLQLSCGEFVDITRAGRLGLVDPLRQVGPNLEEVTFVDDQGATKTTYAAGETLVALRIFVRTTSQGQLVAGLKGSVPIPGWPPDMNARVDDDRWWRPSTMN